MQGKGMIKGFLALLILVSLIQFFYVIPTNKVEKRAEAYATDYAESNPDIKTKEAISFARAEYLDSISSEEILKVPLLGSFTYQDLKARQLALGLDLKGGMSAVLQVDLEEMLSRLSRGSKNIDFRNALKGAKEALKTSDSDYISLFYREYQKQDGAEPLANIFTREASMKELIDYESSNDEVVRVLRQKADETVNLTFNMLKQRIDKLGVAQPNVSLDDARDLILVEIPGIDNPERARQFLQTSAALEFWDTYRVTDSGIQNGLLEADKRLETLTSRGSEEVATPKFDTIYTPSLDSLGNTTGDSTMQVIPRQIDPLSNQGPLLSVLNLNGLGGQLQYESTVIGSARGNQRKVVDRLLNRKEIRSYFPADSRFLWSRSPAKDFESGEMTEDFKLYMIKKQAGKDTAPLEGDVVVSASASPDPTTGEMQVSLSMNGQGAKKWGELTTKAANNGNREVAIVLDDEVVSAPGVNEAILGGRSQITGNFTVQEANDFASILEVGKLPAKVEIIQESTVGPSLGQQNINSSIRALLIGFGLVLLFMVLYYSTGGIVSIIALLLNLVFIFAALASIGTVLTLPGIAGIILTIGMAVDANVIIFERIREELRAGKTMLSSISDGFKHSYSAIIDANVTTILVAIILVYFGLGPIKGFAVVLIVGVLTSIFTAVLVGRLLIDWWTGRGGYIAFWNGFSKNVFANLNVDWIGKRKIAYFVSGSIILAGLASIFIRGFDLGVDFKGGYAYNIEFEDGMNISSEELRAGLADYLDGAPVVKAVNTENTFNIVTSYLINETGEGVADEVARKLHEGVTAISGSTVNFETFKNTDSQGATHIISGSKVGPTIADDIKKSSVYAGIFALLFIFLYIFIRFNKWQFSLGAVAALTHDSLIVLGLFSIFHGILPFSLEIDQAFIAALLTVIGYSINDTVVVFDRIREYLGIYTKKSTDEILNLAINSTFSRTIITSMTTLLVILILLVFGGGSIKGFAFALLVGVLVGTYSSIFVATPLVRDLTPDLRPRVKKEETSTSNKAAKA